jgi:hypothetical protein
MKYFYKYFPMVYSYAAGALTLYALIDWQRDHYHNIFRKNPDLLVCLILGVLIMLVSWVWLLADYKDQGGDDAP